jgi:hypothetical protein
MADRKLDVRAEDLLAWNEYVCNPPDDALQSISLLGDMIKSQKEAADKMLAAAQAAQEKAQAKGAIALTLKGAGAPVPVKVGLDNAMPQDFTGPAWAAHDVAPGNHTVTVITTGTPPITIQKAVIVAAGGIGTVGVEV